MVVIPDPGDDPEKDKKNQNDHEGAPKSTPRLLDGMIAVQLLHGLWRIREIQVIVHHVLRPAGFMIGAAFRAGQCAAWHKRLAIWTKKTFVAFCHRVNAV